MEEKAKQVQRMGEIYAKAANVLIWLGAADDPNERETYYYALLFAEANSAAKSLKTCITEGRLREGWAQDYPVGQGIDTGEHMMTKILAGIYRSTPWFTRM